MRIVTLSVFLLLSISTRAQDIPVFKFGKIGTADIARNQYPVDTNVAAVIIAEVGSSALKGNSKGWFSLEYRIFRRIHILKNAAFDKATVEIELYADGDNEEKLDNLKAATYNLENGKLVETRLDTKSGVFKEKLDKNTVVKKFTLPNVKEGSVIEYEYKITSDFLFNLQPWNFQGDIPRLWSQYTVSIPQFMNYMLIPQGDISYYVSDQVDKNGHYTIEERRETGGIASIPERYEISCGVSDFRWAMKDVPAFREESYISSPMNHIPRLEFQLAGYLPPLTEQKIMTTWTDMTDRMLKRDDFGSALNSAELFWPATLETEIKKVTGELEIARTVYKYVRDHYTCTDRSQLYLQSTLKKVENDKSGGVAEINLLLTALLRYAGLKADPVLLSSRGFAYVQESYPVASRFNYVIVRVNAGGNFYLLDASQPLLGFGKLPNSCYNGSATVADAAASQINLGSGVLQEKNYTNCILQAGTNGKWTGRMERGYGYFGSLAVRGQIRKAGMAEFQQGLQAEYGNDWQLDSLLIDSLQELEKTIQLRYGFSFSQENADLIYLNPVFGKSIRMNPFKQSTRRYPVDMPFRPDESYSLELQVPAGFVVEDLPKPLLLLLNNAGDGNFDYKISQANGIIRLSFRLQFKKTRFEPYEYNMLREFYARVVAKLDEPIVLKKK